MTTPRRLEHDLPALLAEMYVAGIPDYRDDLFRETAAHRQRPAWSFPERWIPMSVATRRLPIAPIPWRLIGVLALVIVTAAIVLLVAAGSQRRHVPPPFGPAANGSLFAAKGGDIVAVDAATGASHTVIGGGGEDDSPGASPDGVVLAFIRTAFGQRSLWAADIDGSHVRQVLTDPLIDDFDLWAPDSRHLGVITRVDSRREFMLVPTDGSGPAVADLGDLDPMEFQFRPPDGREVALKAMENGRINVYLMNVDGTNRRKLDLVGSDAAPGGFELSGFSWSPTGAELAYNVVSHDSTSGDDHLRVHVFALDTKRDRAVADPTRPDAHQAWPSWSPQGTGILVQRFTSGEGWLELLPAEGTASIRAMGPPGILEPNGGIDAGWSPDGGTILLRFDANRFYSIDANTGQSTPLTWPYDWPDWQRLAR
jgi:Tol biopolymer transport system component